MILIHVVIAIWVRALVHVRLIVEKVGLERRVPLRYKWGFRNISVYTEVVGGPFVRD